MKYSYKEKIDLSYTIELSFMDKAVNERISDEKIMRVFRTQKVGSICD